MSLETFRDSAKAQKALIQPQSNFLIGRMTSARWTELSQQLLDLKLISKVESPVDIMVGDL